MYNRYTTHKTVVILQLVKLGYMFRPLPCHHQANKEIVLIKVHLLALTLFLCWADDDWVTAETCSRA